MKPPIKGLSLEMAPKGDVTQHYGVNRDIYIRFGMQGHNGIDLVRPHGEKMYAMENGTVVNVKNDADGFGKHVRFISTKKNDAGYYNEWTYGHCSDIHVNVGDIVAEGEHIADMGNTGFVISGRTPLWPVNPFAGTHLHLGLRNVRKTRKGWSYEGSNIKIDVIDYDNGFKGAINPLPYLKESIKDVPPEHQEMFRQLITIRSIINKLSRLILGK